MPLIRRSLAAPRTLVLLALLAGCSDEDVIRFQELPTLTLAPASLALTVVESPTVSVTATGGGSGPTTFRWTSTTPAIVQVDSVTATVAQTRIRAVAPGPGVVTVSVTRGGQTVTASVPVTVAARPTPPLAISVTPVSSTIGVGDTVRLLATVFRNSPAQDAAATFASLDTAVVTVDAAGLVTAHRVGVAAIRVAPRARPTEVALATVTVVPAGFFGARLQVAPATIVLAPRQTWSLAPALVRGDTVLTRDVGAFLFASADSCTAHVSPAGLLTAGRAGATEITVRSRELPALRAVAPVSIREPAVSRVTIQGIRAGSPPAPADLTALRGAVEVTVNVGTDLLPGTLEVRLGGRLVEARALAASTTDGVTSVTVAINTAARDQATGAPLYPNGQQTLAVTLRAPWKATIPGCPDQVDESTIQLQLTLANPTTAAAGER